MSLRSAGKKGALPQDLSKPRVKLGPALRGTAPSQAHFGWIPVIGMLGNDQWGDCISPETRILTADLRWTPASELSPGDALLGFDEETKSGKKGRTYQIGNVETADIIRRPCYELEFDDGTIIRSSSGHKWLTHSTEQGHLKTQTWVETQHLNIGPVRQTRVVKPLDVWETINSYESGYLAAAFDGEGNLDQSFHNQRQANRISFSQVNNPMLTEVEYCLKELGFHPAHYTQERGGNSGADGSTRQTIHRLTITQRSQWLRFLGSVRPARLLPKLDLNHLGRINGDVVKLVRKDFIGEQDVVFLNTSSRTYFAEGLASHNCVDAGGGHLVEAATFYGQGKEQDVTTTQALAMYTAVAGFNANAGPPGNNPTDNGSTLQDGLEYLVKPNVFDVEFAMFGELDIKNTNQWQLGLAEFGPLMLGVGVGDAEQQDFSDGKPWALTSKKPNPEDHCVILCGYQPGMYFVYTWGGIQAVEPAWFNVNAYEVWGIISKEWVNTNTGKDPEGVDLAVLGQEYASVTGQPDPF